MAIVRNLSFLIPSLKVVMFTLKQLVHYLGLHLSEASVTTIWTTPLNYPPCASFFLSLVFRQKVNIYLSFVSFPLHI